MNKVVMCFVMICFLNILTGCGSNSNITNSVDSPNESIDIGTDIEELVPGFSVVRYDGDYLLDDFLKQGGAESDQGVLRFLAETVFANDYGLQMGGDVFGCSTISVKNADGGYLFGRNFDWQTCDALVVMAYPEDGYASISTVNLNFIKQGAGFAADFMADEMISIAALYAPLDGMNEKGLCVSVNMIQDGATIQQSTEKPDITTTTAVRLMLDKAATTQEALALLEQYDLHASMNYMVHFAISDNTGNSVAVEYVDNKMIVTETPILTNFYLAEGEKYGIGTLQSHTRFEILAETLKENSAMTVLEVRDALDSVSKDNFGEYESTEWSVVFDQSALTATYYHRENYEVGYFFELLDTK